MVTETMHNTGSILGAMKSFQVVATANAECPQHGAYTQSTYSNGRVSQCPTCNREAIAEQEAKEKAARDADDRSRKEHMIAELMGNSGLPPRLSSKTIRSYVCDTPAQDAVVERIKAYGAEFASGHSGRNLAMLGNTGTGKSHLAAALVSHVIRRLNRPARFLSVSALNRLVREAKSFHAQYTESQVIDALASVELLVIDEVGVQSGTDAESRALFDVFNTRYEHMKPTIFISNLQLDDFTVTVGGRVMSRLREDGGEILSFNWQDYRK